MSENNSDKIKSIYNKLIAKINRLCKQADEELKQLENDKQRQL